MAAWRSTSPLGGPPGTPAGEAPEGSLLPPNGAPRSGGPLTARLTCLPAAILLAWSTPAKAAPGQADRLAGAEAQGPATRSLTALHHNPAMLGAMSGFQFQANVRGGLDHRRSRRYSLLDDGSVSDSLGPARNVVDPTADFFLGLSFSFDPVAIAIGAYSLSNRYRLSAPKDQRYHLAVDPDVPGGDYDLHHDFTLAFAWTPLRRLHVGFGFHAPVVFLARSRDDDTHLAGDGNEGVGCGAIADTSIEDPGCAEHISIQTSTSAFNLNVTAGLAVEVNNAVTLGLRYRSPMLLNQGSLQLSGDATVCLPDDAADAELYETGLPRCSEASAVSADAKVTTAQEVAFGVSTVFGNEREWQLDTNFYWVDRCRGLATGWGSRCSGNDAIRASLVGLEQNAAVLPDFRIYRGYQDLFGLELWGTHRIWGEGPATLGSSRVAREDRSGRVRNVALLFGAGVRSPGVRRGSVTLAESELWTLSGNLGARLNLQRRGKNRGGWYIAPGYGVDFVLPSRVGPGGASSDFDPQAALDFAASGRDINGPGAEAVLAGRARPTNAGQYLQDVHVFSLGVGWSELPF